MFGISISNIILSFPISVWVSAVSAIFTISAFPSISAIIPAPLPSLRLFVGLLGVLFVKKILASTRTRRFIPIALIILFFLFESILVPDHFWLPFILYLAIHWTNLMMMIDSLYLGFWFCCNSVSIHVLLLEGYFMIFVNFPNIFVFFFPLVVIRWWCLECCWAIF